MSNEPVIAGYSVTAMLTIVIAFVVAMDWWNPTPEQITALTALVVMVASVVLAWWTRRRVTPTSKVNATILAAVADAVPLPPPNPEG